MAEFEYENFTLKIDHDANGYVANVLASPVGQASERFNMPKLDDDLSAVFQELETTRNTSNLTRDASGQLDSQFQQGAIKALGEKLFSVVFGGEIGTAYQRSLDSVKTKGKGLRIQLRTSHSLSEIPWEYLRDPQGPGRFLFHSEQQSLSRYLELPVGIQAFSLKPPLRILVMISNPSNARSLNVELEWEKLNSAFKNLKEENLVDIKRIPATLEDLQAVLKQQGCHIFHFIGHGGFDAQHGGVLLMEDDQRKARKVDAETIASQLQDIPTLQLVVLNACKGARATLSNPFAGIAQTLVAGSVPAVVAMQYPISDEVAITFAKRFYGSLARAAPVDTAIAQARKAIFALEFGKFEFGIPVLYTRSPDGHIFDVQGGDQAIDP